MENEQTPFYDALVGWEISHPLLGSSYGYGEARYYDPGEVSRIADDLKAAPGRLLQARFGAQAGNFRLAAASCFADDRAILDHQRRFAELLRRLYVEAQQDGDVVLLLMV